MACHQHTARHVKAPVGCSPHLGCACMRCGLKNSTHIMMGLHRGTQDLFYLRACPWRPFPFHRVHACLDSGCTHTTYRSIDIFCCWCLPLLHVSVQCGFSLSFTYWSICVIASPPGGMQSTVVSFYVCLPVRPSVRVSQKPHCRASPNFLWLVACGRVARAFSDVVASRYVLPVLWMASCFRTVNSMQRSVAKA